MSGDKHDVSGDLNEIDRLALEQLPPVYRAAPDLLEALELVESHYGEDSDVFYVVRAAIKRAKGEQP